MRFAQAWPDVDISVVEGSYNELAGPLRDGEIDMILGALRDDATTDGLMQEAVFVDRPVMVMRCDHPLLQAADPASAMLAFNWI